MYSTRDNTFQILEILEIPDSYECNDKKNYDFTDSNDINEYSVPTWSAWASTGGNCTKDPSLSGCNGTET